jgi:hypothetical protein
MKRIALLIAALLMTSLTTSCAPKSDDSTQIRTGGNGDRARSVDHNPGQTGSVSGVPLNGAVLSDPGSQDAFNELVRDMMEMVIDRDSVGYVAAQPDGHTGLYVGAKVTLEGGARVQNSSANAYASTTSKLAIAVFDRFDNANLPGLPGMIFQLRDGYVNGSNVVLEFEQKGSSGTINNYVRLEGTINGQWFNATMYFDVQNMWDGSGNGHSGYFQYANFKTCDVFACN